MRSEDLGQGTVNSRFPSGTDTKGRGQTCAEQLQVELCPPPVYYISDLAKLSLSPQYLIPVLASVKGYPVCIYQSSKLL